MKVLVNDKYIGVNVCGHGSRSIILLAGWTHDFRSETRFLKELSKFYKVVSISYPGYYESEPDIRSQSMEYLSNVVIGVIRELNIENFILVGFSMGCQVALKVINKYKLDNKVVLVSPILHSLTNSVPWYGKIILASDVLLGIVRKIEPIKKFIVNQGYRRIGPITEGRKKRIYFDGGNISLDGAFDTLIATIKDHVNIEEYLKQTKLIFGGKEILYNKLPRGAQVKLISGMGHGGFDKYFEEIVSAIVP